MNRRFSSIGILFFVASLVTVTPIVASAGMTTAVPTASASTIAVVPLPISLGYDPSNGYVYVGGFNGSISVISGSSVVGTIPSSEVGYTAQLFAYSPSNQEMYVAGGNGVARIMGLNAAVNVPEAGSTPQTMMYDPSHAYVYVANLGAISILASDNGLKGVLAANPRPGGLVYDSFDNYTYASYVIQSGAGSETGTQVNAYSGVNLVGNVTLPGGLGGFVAPVYDACHDYVYVADSSMQSVSVIWARPSWARSPSARNPRRWHMTPRTGWSTSQTMTAGQSP